MPSTYEYTSSPVAVMDWRSGMAGVDKAAATRSVGGQELVKNQLNDLTASNSQYIKQARDRANSQASSVGMMTGSMAAGNAQRAAIDAALPIASQDASTHSRVASENMAAQNADALADQQIGATLLGQEVGIRANLDEAERNRGWQTGERQATQAWQTGEREATQGWQTGEREAGQVWQTGEREATQGWQTGEREAGQVWQGAQNTQQQQHQLGMQREQNSWQSGESAADRTWRGDQQQIQNLWQENQNELQRIHEVTRQQMEQNFNGSEAEKARLQQRFEMFNNTMTNFNAQLSQNLTAIYSNTNLTAAEQNAAAANARATYQSLFTSYAATMTEGVPEIFWAPYQQQFAQPAPAGTTAPVVGILPPGSQLPVTTPAGPSTPYRGSIMGETIYRAKYGDGAYAP